MGFNDVENKDNSYKLMKMKVRLPRKACVKLCDRDLLRPQSLISQVPIYLQATHLSISLITDDTGFHITAINLCVILSLN